MKIINLPISECVHPRGFRYGGFGHNPYEDYVLGLVNGSNIHQLKSSFTKRIAALDGSDFGSILGIALKKKYAPWVYPWSFKSLIRNKIKYFSPQNNPDIVCHTSPDGILASHLNREFFWLERALNATMSGYKPEKFSYVTALHLRRKNENRYLVIDGNHRLSAMHALQEKNVLAVIKKPFLCDIDRHAIWPGIITNTFDIEDGDAIFNRYFYEFNIKIPEIKLQKIIYDEPLEGSQY